MKISPGQAIETIKNFFCAYLAERDIEKTASYLDGEIDWVGTGKNEFAQGRRAVLDILRDELTDTTPNFFIQSCPRTNYFRRNRYDIWPVVCYEGTDSKDHYGGPYDGYLPDGAPGLPDFGDSCVFCGNHSGGRGVFPNPVCRRSMGGV